jgi:hypothetical protein
LTSRARVLVAEETEADRGLLQQVGLVLRLLHDVLDVLDRVAAPIRAERDGDVALDSSPGRLQLLAQDAPRSVSFAIPQAIA